VSQVKGSVHLIYQPQVDDWQNCTDIKWRAVFQLTPNGEKQIVGAASFEATTEVNTDNHTVLLFNINVTNTYFPGRIRLQRRNLTNYSARLSRLL
jgi:hypothetical protein